MKIVFMGTPDFAVGCLKKLVEENHEIAAVFTQPDKPVGRKQVMTPPAVKTYAAEQGLSVYQPATVKDGAAYEIIKEINPDICVVVAYGKLLPDNILTLPKYGCVNVHASLLPKYRGASPIQWAIVCGERETGVSTMRLDSGMDTGDILMQSSTAISDTDTAEIMFDRLRVMGAELLSETLKGLENGTVAAVKQNNDEATYAPIIKKTDALIDFSKSAHEINCMIRGLQSWPTAYTVADGKRLKIFSATPEKYSGGTPGEIIEQSDALVVACGKDSALRITDLQLEGSKRMSARDLLRGRKFERDCFIKETV